MLCGCPYDRIVETTKRPTCAASTFHHPCATKGVQKGSNPPIDIMVDWHSYASEGMHNGSMEQTQIRK